jgi:hypothetical protein
MPLPNMIYQFLARILEAVSNAMKQTPLWIHHMQSPVSVATEGIPVLKKKRKHIKT